MERPSNNTSKDLRSVPQNAAVDVASTDAALDGNEGKKQTQATPGDGDSSTADIALNADEPPDLEALLEERRRKRRELLERLAGTQSGVNSATPSSLDGSTGAQSTGTTGKWLHRCHSLPCC